MYPKIASWLLLHKARAPTLDGVVVSEWTASATRVVKEFAAARKLSALLVRSDHAEEDGLSPRAGYVAEVGLIEDATSWLLSQGRVVFLLEPRSPFDDKYSLSLARGGDDSWVLEVAGPGFDASDLKRGDISPHEVIIASARRAGYELKRDHIVSPEAYRRSRDARFEKVGALLRGSAKPGGPAVEDREAVATCLRKIGETHLVHAHAYEPIPEALVERAVCQCDLIEKVLRDAGEPISGITISMSYVGLSVEPVYWDLVWPDRKYRIGPPRGSLGVHS